MVGEPIADRQTHSHRQANFMICDTFYIIDFMICDTSYIIDFYTILMLWKTFQIFWVSIGQYFRFRNLKVGQNWLRFKLKLCLGCLFPSSIDFKNSSSVFTIGDIYCPN